MSVRAHAEAIVAELAANSQSINDDEMAQLIAALQQAGHIFLAGAGRSGVAIAAFANRLMHLGFSVSVVGEVTAPHTRPGDLLVICSGSGETTGLVALAQKACQAQVKLAVITASPSSRLAGLADYRVSLSGVASKQAAPETRQAALQPMGSAFEQLCLVVYDALVLALMATRAETHASMMARHADLE
ncbi:6-phospho 3-hexuloisomerase [Paramixta manurensis]|uniref:6-phospho 3-hexuloisomerase n=1 Tax=Paramixta manurensis TaxID=2740817 RepID=A0A6M8U676_9GAMM|nr:6-phospho 3-hexuloisomerase [Erwiniaceae bacterium PD-1]